MEEGLYEYNPNVLNDFLRQGKRVFPIASDDNHNQSRNDSFGGFTMINCDNLNYPEVMQSLKNGDFYSSSGPEISEISVYGDTVKIKCSNAKFICMSTCGRRTDRLKAKENEFVTEAEFKFIPDDIYFRIDVVDQYGKRANSRAYFIDEL